MAESESAAPSTTTAAAPSEVPIVVTVDACAGERLRPLPPASPNTLAPPSQSALGDSSLAAAPRKPSKVLTRDTYSNTAMSYSFPSPSTTPSGSPLARDAKKKGASGQQVKNRIAAFETIGQKEKAAMMPKQRSNANNPRAAGADITPKQPYRSPYAYTPVKVPPVSSPTPKRPSDTLSEKTSGSQSNSRNTLGTSYVSPYAYKPTGHSKRSVEVDDQGNPIERRASTASSVASANNKKVGSKRGSAESSTSAGRKAGHVRRASLVSSTSITPSTKPQWKVVGPPQVHLSSTTTARVLYKASSRGYTKPMSPTTSISSSDAFASKLTSITSTATVTIAARNQMAAGLASRDIKRPQPSPKHKPTMTATTIRLAPGMKPSDVKAASRLAAAANTPSSQPPKAKSPVPDKRPMTPKPHSNISSPRSRTASPAPGVKPTKKTPSSASTTPASPAIRKTPSKSGSGSSKPTVTSLKIVTAEEIPSSPLATIPPASVSAISPIPLPEKPAVEEHDIVPSSAKLEPVPSETAPVVVPSSAKLEPVSSETAPVVTADPQVLAAINEEEDLVSSVVISAKTTENEAVVAEVTAPAAEPAATSAPLDMVAPPVEEKKMARRLTMLTGWLFGKKSTPTPPVSEAAGSVKDSQDDSSIISMASVATEEAVQPAVVVKESAVEDVVAEALPPSTEVDIALQQAVEVEMAVETKVEIEVESKVEMAVEAKVEMAVEGTIAAVPMKVEEEEAAEIQTSIPAEHTLEQIAQKDHVPQVVTITEQSEIEAKVEDHEMPTEAPETAAQEIDDVEMVDAGVIASEAIELSTPAIPAPIEEKVVEQIQIAETAVLVEMKTRKSVVFIDPMDVVMEEESDTPDAVPGSETSTMVLEEVSVPAPISLLEPEILSVVLEEHEDDDSTEMDERMHVPRPSNHFFDEIDDDLSDSVPVESVSLHDMVVDELKNNIPVLAERISLDDLRKEKIALDQEVPVEHVVLDDLLMERHIPVERVALDELMLETRTNSDSSRSGSYGDIDMLRPSPPATPETIYDAKPFTISDFKLIKTVGTGSFGRVHLALHTKTNTYVALKVLRKLDVVKLKQVEHTLDEKRILEALCNGCPFLVHLYGSFVDCEYLYLVLEYIQGGELFTYLRNVDKLDNESAKFYAAEVVLAFEYLHSANVVYRDLKPENLLIDSRGHIRVTDFGFAKHLEGDETHTLCGTPDYLAPEVIQAKGYGKAVDWWALGILIYEMIAGHPPFFDDDPFRLYEKIVACRLAFPPFMHPLAKDLIRRLLTPDLSRRYGNLRDGALDIKMHPWFQGIDWDAMWELRMDAPYIPDVEGDGDTSHFDEYEEDYAPYGRNVPDPYADTFKDF
ncbi:hypothetical protein CcCBS67573_g03961 [Chytriomyces confervae]|uniref:cAMP-dependent protein kinase n=1 Tax=Chytriomyces confervae TaxID=246404 RepID=A0A507FEJ5_9FUNG|nr:hypothetical protein HDU80_011164 [Chytriomyces hyalinus]TPX74771.1 hypothetical protein CcCBS67573_g03961 [Chytriomyces confervae]